MRIAIIIAGLLVLPACATQPDYRSETAAPPTVSSVDLDRYVGKWFEIAKYPNSFQKNCGGVTAEYARRDDARISVINTCNSGNARVAKGAARVVEGSGNARLKVKFAPAWVPFAEGDYWILHLEDDYSAALVGDPGGKYLWILSRTTTLPNDKLARVKAKAEVLGFQTEPLEMTAH